MEKSKSKSAWERRVMFQARRNFEMGQRLSNELKDRVEIIGWLDKQTSVATNNKTSMEIPTL